QPILTKNVFLAARNQHGEIFDETQLSAKVLRPLEAQGWITLSGQGGGRGRGGKSGQIAPTAKLLDLDPRRLSPGAEEHVPADLVSRLNTPLDQIYEDLE